MNFETTNHSENSYGFRTNRNGKEYMDEGYQWAVDIDSEKYFDTVNHDKLIGQIIKK